MAAGGATPILAITQGDPAGVGPETLIKVAIERPDGFCPLLIGERSALSQAASSVEGADELNLVDVGAGVDRAALLEIGDGAIPLLDPVAEPRSIQAGSSAAGDAAAAIACLDAGIRLARSGTVDALVTAPVSKLSIARFHDPGFRGHTDYIARACGLERYGRDYLMTFLAEDLQVALVTTHVAVTEAVELICEETIIEAVSCLDRHAGGRIAVAGLNPHAGEGGLLGREDLDVIAPAVAACRVRGIEVSGPESADSLFARCRKGEFDWALAPLHDQGLIAVKTVAFGSATNWTLGLPFIRTSVDHGTAFERAGLGRADARPLMRVCEATVDLVRRRLPRRGSSR